MLSSYQTPDQRQSRWRQRLRESSTQNRKKTPKNFENEPFEAPLACPNICPSKRLYKTKSSEDFNIKFCFAFVFSCLFVCLTFLTCLAGMRGRGGSRRSRWTNVNIIQHATLIGQYKTWTADYGLRTGYKIRTRYKTRTRKYGLGIKHGQGIKRGLRTADWV